MAAHLSVGMDEVAANEFRCATGISTTGDIASQPIRGVASRAGAA